ncbi:MAG: carboxypeptidase M32 [Opitutales bacterium]
MSTTPTACEALVAQLREVHCLGSIEGLLSWDEQVNLPSGGVELRARQLAAMAEVVHRAATDKALGKAIEAAEAQAREHDLNDRQTQTLLRFARRDFDQATRLPGEFIKRRALAQSNAFHAWKTAREANDFATFAPHLERLLDLAREEAAYCGFADARAYDYWLDRHDPGVDTAFVTQVFDALRAELVPLAETILEAARGDADKPSLFRGFPVDAQERFLRSVIESLGFDFQRGRIDRSVHPFCAGSPPDVRMTTRFDPDNPLDAIFSSIHETGHGLYEQGLPLEHLGTPLCEAAGMAVHESQSRLWENQVCRGRPFWTHWEPFLRKCFPQQTAGVSSHALYRAINSVGLSPIRVDADEVTYNLHVLLRFEIEQRLFDGSLSARTLPEAWNALSKEILLGLVPANDAQGCLQDIHWSFSGFGYFPSYTLGNLLAAQLWYAALEQIPDLEAGFARGDYAPLLDWLRMHIHRHGKQYDLREYANNVTGQTLAHTALIRYLRERYLTLFQTP